MHLRRSFLWLGSSPLAGFRFLRARIGSVISTSRTYSEGCQESLGLGHSAGLLNCSNACLPLYRLCGAKQRGSTHVTFHLAGRPVSIVCRYLHCGVKSNEIEPLLPANHAAGFSKDYRRGALPMLRDIDGQHTGRVQKPSRRDCKSCSPPPTGTTTAKKPPPPEHQSRRTARPNGRRRNGRQDRRWPARRSRTPTTTV